MQQLPNFLTFHNWGTIYVHSLRDTYKSKLKSNPKAKILETIRKDGEEVQTICWELKSKNADECQTKSLQTPKETMAKPIVANPKAKISRPSPNPLLPIPIKIKKKPT